MSPDSCASFKASSNTCDNSFEFNVPSSDDGGKCLKTHDDCENWSELQVQLSVVPLKSCQTMFGKNLLDAINLD
jgi:hypothetical protein